MAPTFKISFPLPGWRPGSTNSTPGSGASYTSRSDGDGSPLMYPGSKAERVLGGTDYISEESRKRETRRERKALKKSPSYMSVTLADEDGDRNREEEGFPFPGMLTPSENQVHVTHRLSRQGSSPLLGNNAYGITTLIKAQNATAKPVMRKAESSTTMRGTYDRAPGPLSSHSSSSVATPWKATPQKPSPLSHAQVEAHYGASHQRQPSTSSKQSDNSKTSASMIASIPRRRPSVLDPPTLYPNTPRVYHAVSPPPALINSSLPRSMQPGTAPGRRRWWHRNRSEGPSLQAVLHDAVQEEPERPEKNMSTLKMNVRRPKAGVRDWFDGLDEDEMHFEGDDEFMDNAEPLLDDRPGSRDGPLSIADFLGSTPRNDTQGRTLRKNSFSTQTGPANSKILYRPEPAQSEATYSYYSSNGSLGPSVSSGPQSSVSKETRSTRSGRGIQEGIDLHMDSMLSLSSSSEDEDADHNAYTASSHESRRHHRVRASVEQADYGDNALLGSAERAQHLRPRPVVNRHAKKTSSRRSEITEAVPPVPQIPARPQLVQRRSSLRWRDMADEAIGGTTTDTGEASSMLESGETSANNTETPLTSPLSVRTASTYASAPNRRKSSMRASKLMKVTTEEERLLEAMREKRASIRNNDFQKGFKSAVSLQGQSEEPHSARRPLTAGADGRATFHRSSSVYETIVPGSNSGPTLGSLAPFLTSARYNPRTSGHGGHGSGSGSSGYGRIAQMVAGLRRSMSAENLHEMDHDEVEAAYPFPQIPDIVRHERSVYSSNASPSLSFSPSDALSSAPSTRHSPITPPPTMPMPSASGALGSGPSGMLLGLPREDGGLGRGMMGGHDRKRTVSSGIVNLDGMETAALQADEERELVGWAMDHY